MIPTWLSPCKSAEFPTEVKEALAMCATALHHNLTILTYNRKHFARIPDLKIYPA